MQVGEKTLPQGLKPDKICGIYGTAEAAPFQSKEFFPSRLGMTLFVTAKFSGAVNSVSLENAQKSSRVAVTAAYGVLQEDQSEDVRWTQLGYAIVR
jgi:hypothetical protein